jgi:hypothetical protein
MQSTIAAANLAFIPTVGHDDGLNGVRRLLRSIAPRWNCPEPLVLDFSRCRFAGADVAAILASFKLYRDSCGATTEIDWDTIQDPINRQLVRWQVSRLFGETRELESPSAIPILHQPALDQNSLVQFVDGNVVCKMPEMTADLARVTRREICELFNNVFDHAESPFGGIVVGQVYPVVREFQLCVCDGGRGLVEKVQSCGISVRSPHEAIEWALQRGNSTLRSGGPSGLGLHTLSSFVESNSGKIRIYANDGFYCQSGIRRFGGILNPPYAGTLVEFRFNLDGMTYGLQQP